MLLRNSLIFMLVGLLVSSNSLFLQETRQKCYQHLCKTPKFPISCVPVLSLCCFLGIARRLSMVSESFIQLSSKEHTLIPTGWQGKVTLYTYSPRCSGSKMKHQSPACCRLKMCWPKGISPLLQALSIVICHSRIKAWEHMRAARILSSPLPAHCTKPLGCASHKSHVPFYTPPYIPFAFRHFVSSSPPDKAYSASCSNTNGNLSKGCG